MIGIIKDLRRCVPRFDESTGIVLIARCVASMVLHPGWMAIFNLRLASGLRKIYLHPFSWLLYRLNMHLFAMDIHPSVTIGWGAWMPHPLGIVIARDSTIGEDSTIFQNVTIGGRGQPSVIGNRVVIGAGACILGPAKLGDNVTVGANSVVTKDVPSDTTVVGSPARPIE